MKSPLRTEMIAPPGFRHDVAPKPGAGPAFVNRPIDLICLIAAALWLCGQRTALSKLVLQDKRHTHSPLRFGLGRG